jgi:hypothetical protein
MAEVKVRTPEQVFKKWLKSLRSGKYQQGQGCLMETDCYDHKAKYFCCLGVLQDIAVKDGGAAWESANGPCGSDAEPSKAILNYLGLTQEMIDHLVSMNDDDGASFEDIADEIETNIMPALGY